MKIRQTIAIDIFGMRYATRLIMFLAQKVFSARPIPWPIVRLARRISSHRNALVSDREVAALDVSKVNNAQWRTLLEASGRQFDQWSFNEDSLNVLEMYLRMHRPRYALEFGCGLSTFCTALLLNEFWGADGDWMVFGVEQDENHARWVRDTLARAGLDGHVRIKVAPLAVQTVLDRETNSYDLSPADMDAFLQGARPSLVVIDGPFGDGPVRLATLPLALPFLDQNAVVLLDDAFRDNEILIMDAWKRHLGVRVNGVRPLRSGLAEITVRGCQTFVRTAAARAAADERPNAALSQAQP